MFWWLLRPNWAPRKGLSLYDLSGRSSDGRFLQDGTPRHKAAVVFNLVLTMADSTELKLTSTATRRSRQCRGRTAEVLAVRKAIVI